MKKVLTAMTAMSMTLQASENTNQEKNLGTLKDNHKQLNVEEIKSEIMSQYFVDNPRFSKVGSIESNEGTQGASGSFLTVDKYVRLGFDTDSSGTVSGGDVLIYDIVTRNSGEVNASGSFLDDIPDQNTSLIDGSVITTQGNVVQGNNPNDTTIAVAINNIVEYDTVVVSYAVTVNAIPDGQIIDITNQALVSTLNIGLYISDDPNTFNQAFDPTVIQAYGITTELYNEFDSGDFVEHYQIPNQLQLRTELERVSGDIGGAEIDLEDCFQFDVEESRVVQSIMLENYETTGNNTNTAFHIYYNLPPVKFENGDFSYGTFGQDDIGSDLIEFRTMQPGTYSICLVEGTPEQRYSLVIQSEIEDDIFNNGFD